MQYTVTIEGSQQQHDLESLRKLVAEGKIMPNDSATYQGEEVLISDLLENTDADEESHDLAHVASGEAEDPSANHKPIPKHHHAPKIALSTIIWLVLGILLVSAGIIIAVSSLTSPHGG